MTLTTQSFKNEVLDCSISCYLKNDQIWFKGKDIADILDYTNPQKAIRDHIDNDDKTNFADFGKGERFVQPLDPQTIMINESGLYSLIFGSKMEKAKMFKKWVTSEVLPTIRKTGKFELRPSSITRRLTFRIENEHDLQVAVVSFIRQFYPSCSFHSTLGELQDTSEKRIDAYCMGYSTGIPDIIITEASKGYTGMMIELKTPKGTGELSEKQNNQIKTLELKGNHVLVSNDYNLIILAIKKYLDNVRYLCLKCIKRPKAYCSLETLKKHLIGFHKIVLE